jgi:hypothetical protein
MSKDWQRLAAALDPPIPASDVEKIAPVLDALDAAFRRLQSEIPAGTPIWTGPVDSE